MKIIVKKHKFFYSFYFQMINSMYLKYYFSTVNFFYKSIDKPFFFKLFYVNICTVKESKAQSSITATVLGWIKVLNTQE